MTTWIAVVVGGALLAGPALASPCGERVKALQTRYDANPILAGAVPLGGIGAPETTGAMLHHQPSSAGAAADASDPAMSPESLRNARFRDAMDQAVAADHSQDEPGCEAALRTAEGAYDRK